MIVIMGIHCVSDWPGACCGKESKGAISTPNTNRCMFAKSDKLFRDSFAEYHFEKAVLRITCASCNLTRAKL